jgi:nucleotide-binding universal stress UspA family protein
VTGPVLASNAGMGIVQVTRRLHDEFTAMPGLRLTSAQVRRLCAADAWTAASALRSLVSAGFLTVTTDGQYARTDIVAGRPATRSALRPQAMSTARVAWRRIVCLVEFEPTSRDALSAGSHAALRYATALAATHRARVTALHVIPASSQQTTSHGAIAKRLVGGVSGEGLRELIDVQAAAGSPSEELLRVATQTHADLIVLAAGEPAGAAMSHGLVRQAPCPVLMVHRSGRVAVP